MPLLNYTTSVPVGKTIAEIEGMLAKREEADAKRREADAKWEEADAKRREAYAAYLPQFEKLHKKECNCTEWNGKKLVFTK